jgi:citrate lyase synthetase
VIHERELDLLRINATTKGELDLYREVFGNHLFKNAAYVGTKAKYLLDPIRSHKRECQGVTRRFVGSRAMAEVTTAFRKTVAKLSTAATTGAIL